MTFDEIKEKYKSKELTANEAIKKLNTEIKQLEKNLSKLKEHFFEDFTKYTDEEKKEIEELQTEKISFSEYEKKKQAIIDKQNEKIGLLEHAEKESELKTKIIDCKSLLADLILDTENETLEVVISKLTEAMNNSDRKKINILKAKIKKLISNRISELESLSEQIDEL